MKQAASLAALMLALTACSFAPDYRPPDMPTPAPEAYKESAGWIEAQPADIMDRGAWWKIFHDEQLNVLEDKVTAANQNLKIALAQYEQAHAAAAQARAAYFPQVTGNISASRSQISRNTVPHSTVTRFNDFTLGADLSYELDLWGRVRNSVAASEDQAAASVADLAGVALSLHAEMAANYFALRGDNLAQDILDKTVAADQQAYDLTKRRFDGGISAEGDVDQAETQLQNAKTQASDMRLQRSQLEHAIAILTGQMPENFSLPVAPMTASLPNINPGLPSTLLERRPDIAAAERRVASANAEIGVARAAWFPTFSLTGSAGFESALPATWFAAPSHFWSLGPTASLPFIDGGRISALNDEARASYDEAVASYRQTVLVAYQDVEDSLAAMHHLAEERKSADAAAKAASRALKQAQNLYSGGATIYLDVVVAQNTELQAKLAKNDILTRHLIASVTFIQALGGGWMVSDLNAPLADKTVMKAQTDSAMANQATPNAMHTNISIGNAPQPLP